jgi:DNA-binding GntR family transcriptional regulator
MSPGPTFERVYLELKRQLREGTRPPGTPLEPTVIGDELSTSFTPVRDALHRLVGEGLVENPLHNGFAVPRPTEQALRDLYSWNGQIAALALSAQTQTMLNGDAIVVEGDPATGVEGLFAALAAETGNLEHGKAIASLNDRLAPYRRAEQVIFGDLVEEHTEIRAALEKGTSAARAALSRYHKRRIVAVPTILGVLSAV